MFWIEFCIVFYFVCRDTPGAMRAVLDQHPSLFYMKEVSFKSRDSHNLNHQLRLIKELQKRVRLRQKKKETEADLVEQQDLIPDRSGKPSNTRNYTVARTAR